MTQSLTVMLLLLLGFPIFGSDNYVPKLSKDGKLNQLTQYPDSVPLEVATFAAGCFWGVESAYRQTKGVTKTVVGYTGGQKEKPTYYQVSSGNTGHAEAVQVTFNPKVVSYDELLAIFWKVHDPTQVNRQGPDVGTQYRSAVFFHSEAQKKSVEESIEALKKSGEYSKPIATQVVAEKTFYPAEEYHQQYFEKIAKRRFGIK